MHSNHRNADFIVESVKANGKPFRPSDWIERISTQLATYGPDHRLRYAESVHPCIIDGAKCLCVKHSLQEHNPEAYQFILKFAEDNELRIQEDRRTHSTAVTEERRTSFADSHSPLE